MLTHVNMSAPVPRKPLQSHAYHHGDLRRALLDAVLALVAERGHAADITFREVARRVGVSHAAPYRHFDDKEALLAELATEGFARLSSTLMAARRDARDDEERFVQTGIGYLKFALANPGYLTLMHGPDVPKSRSAGLQAAANQSFQVLILLAEDAGITDLVEARRFGVVVWSFIYGVTTLWTQRQIPASVEADAEALVVLGLRRLFRSAQ